MSVNGESALELKPSSGSTEVPISKSLNDDNNNAPEVSNESAKEHAVLNSSAQSDKGTESQLDGAPDRKS